MRFRHRPLVLAIALGLPLGALASVPAEGSAAADDTGGFDLKQLEQSGYSADIARFFAREARFMPGLQTDGHLTLPTQTQTQTQTQTLMVNCGSGQTYLSMWPTDNREGTAVGGVDNERYGLGRMIGRPTSTIGGFMVMVDTAKVDGTTTQVGSYSISRGQMHLLPYNYLRPRVASGKDELAVTWAQGRSGTWADLSTMVAGSVFEMNLNVMPWLASTSEVGGGAPITESVELDGSALVTLRFGL